MHLEEALYTYLSTYAGLIALTSTRIYPKEKPAQPLHAETEWRRRNVMRVYEMLTGEDNC